MTTPLTHYAKIKDNYCIGYFGQDDEVLTNLCKARNSLEDKFPGLKIYLVCNDEKIDLFKEARLISKSNLEENHKNFAYYRVIKESVEELL